MVALPPVDDPEVVERVGFACPVTVAVGDAAGEGVDGERVRQVPGGVEVRAQACGQGDGVSVPAVVGGVHADGNQVGQLHVQPEPGGVRVGQCRHRGSRLRNAGPAVRIGGVQGIHGGGRGGQVVVE